MPLTHYIWVGLSVRLSVFTGFDYLKRPISTCPTRDWTSIPPFLFYCLPNFEPITIWFCCQTLACRPWIKEVCVFFIYPRYEVSHEFNLKYHSQWLLPYSWITPDESNKGNLFTSHSFSDPSGRGSLVFSHDPKPTKPF